MQKRKTKKDRLTSKVWDHFTMYDSHIACNYKNCDKRYATSCATSTLQRHYDKHLLAQDNLNQTTLNSFLKLELTQEVIDDLLMSWVIQSIQPFTIVEEKSFQKLFHSVYKNLKLMNRKQLKIKIQTKYDELKEDIYEQLLNFNGKIALTCDCWTSSNAESFLGITAHLIDYEWNFQSFCLHFDYLNESHTAEYLSSQILSTINDYDLLRKVIAITTDGAPNITKSIKLIQQQSESKIFHIYCFSHRLHNVVMVGLSSLSDKYNGLLCRVRKLVTKIKKSTIFTQQLKDNSKTTKEASNKVIMDVQTRWNSTYEMLQRFLELKKSINMLINSNEKLFDQDFQKQDFEHIKLITSFLEPFYDATMILQSQQTPTISDREEIYQELLSHLHEQSDNPELTEASIIMIEKLESNQEDPNNLNQISSHFDPRNKFNNHGQEKEQLKLQMNNIFQQDYFQDQTYEESKEPLSSTETEISKHKQRLFKKRKQEKSTQSIDQINMYADLTNPTDDTIILKWWQSNQINFPQLSLMARDYLTPQVTSTPSEQLFSLAARITQNRSKLNPSTVTQLICCNSWLKLKL